MIETADARIATTIAETMTVSAILSSMGATGGHLLPFAHAATLSSTRLVRYKTCPITYV